MSIVSTGATTSNPTPVINTAGGGILTIGTLSIIPVAAFTSVVNSGTGTLTLGGDVTFTAATTGQAQISGNLGLGGATRTFTVGLGTGVNYDMLIDAAISSGALTKAGSGRLLFSGANTFTGSTTLNAGTLSVSADANLGNGNGLVFNGGTLQVTGTVFTNFGTHTPTFTSAQTVFLDINNVANVVTVGQVLNQASGGLTKLGAGTLALTAANSFTGNTTVSAGRLTLGEGGSMAGTAVNVNTAGAIYGMARSTSGASAQGGSTLTLASGTALDLVDGAYNTMSYTGAGTLSGANLYLNLGASGAAAGSDKVTFGGAVTLTGTNKYVFSPLGPSLDTTPGAYTLMTAGSGLNGSALTLLNATVVAGNTVYALVLNNTGTASILTATALGSTPATAYWAGDRDANWDTSDGMGLATNWRDAPGGGIVTLTPGTNTDVHFYTVSPAAANLASTQVRTDVTIQSLTFDGGALTTAAGIGGSRTLTIAPPAPSAGLTVNSGAGSVTISANVGLGAAQTWTQNSASRLTVSGAVSGGNSLTTAGTGNIILSGANSYSGSTTVSSGTLLVGHTLALAGTTGVTVAGTGRLNFYTGTGSTVSPYIVNVGSGGFGTLSLAGGTSIGGELGGMLKAGTATTPGSGTVYVDVYGSPGIASPAGNTYTLVSAASGLNSGYTLALGKVRNNYNFTVVAGNLANSATAITVNPQAATALTAAFWKGGLAGENNVWSASDGSTKSNWVLTNGGADQPLIPSGVLVTFSSSTVATAPTATVLGVNMSVSGIAISDTVNGLGLNADGNTLTIGASGITMANGVPNSSIGANIALSGSQTWNNNSTTKTLTIKGNLIANGFTFGASGASGSTICLSGNSSGVFSTANNFGLVNGGSKLIIDNGYNLTYNETHGNNLIIIGQGSSGNTLTVSNGGMFSNSGNFSISKDNGGANNTLNITSGGIVSLGGRFQLGNNGTGDQIKVDGAGSLLTGGYNWFNMKGAISITNGGKINSPSFQATPASLTVTVSGTDSTTGTGAMLNFITGGLNLPIAGETLNVSSGGILQFGTALPSMILLNTGSVTINGGVLSYYGATGVDMSASKTPAANTVGAFTWTGLNSFRLSGSTDTGTTAYTFANNLGAANYTALQLYGTTSIDRAITFDGGNGGALLVNGATAMMGGGVTLTNSVSFSAQGTASTLMGVIGGSGAMVKSGPSALTLTSVNTYTGDTRVQEGTLGITHPCLYGGGDVRISAGAIMDLNFIGTNTVRYLFLGGHQYHAGLFGRDGEGGPVWFSGTGFLKIEPGTTIIIR